MADLVAFTRGGDVWVVGSDGRGERRLTADLAYDRPIAWTASGREVIHWTNPADWHLGCVDVATGARRDLTPEGGDCRSASPSPDGRLVAFMSGRDGLSVVGSEGEERRALSQLGHRDEPPAWSPDGSRLAFTDLRSVDGQHVLMELYVAELGAGEPARMATHAENPVWSADGRSLFCVARDGTGPDIVVIDVATKATRKLTATPAVAEADPSLSPDGRRLAFIAWSSDFESCELRVLHVDPGAPPRVRTLAPLEGRPSAPSWSPDSTRIAITSGPAGASNLLLIDASSGSARRLTTDGASFAVWRPRR